MVEYKCTKDKKFKKDRNEAQLNLQEENSVKSGSDHQEDQEDSAPVEETKEKPSSFLTPVSKAHPVPQSDSKLLGQKLSYSQKDFDSNCEFNVSNLHKNTLKMPELVSSSLLASEVKKNERLTKLIRKKDRAIRKI